VRTSARVGTRPETTTFLPLVNDVSPICCGALGTSATLELDAARVVPEAIHAIARTLDTGIRA